MIPNYLESSLLKDLLQITYDTLASNMYADKINILCFKGVYEAASTNEWPHFPHL